jgi:phosphohistidine phosphatase SixA
MTVHSPIVRTIKTIVEAEVQSMPLTQVHMTVHSPIVRTTKTIVEAEVQSMPLTQVHVTVHSPIVRTAKTIVVVQTIEEWAVMSTCVRRIDCNSASTIVLVVLTIGE